MNTTKHTPGPWKFAHGTDEQLVHEWSDVAYIDTRIPERTKAEQIANARLISAAPELLDALRDIIGQCDDGKAALDNNGTYKKARAAIAKATGQNI